MTTRLLDSRRFKELQPSYGLFAQYHPERATYRFRARTSKAAISWQKKARQALAKTVGFQQFQRTALNPRRIERVDKTDYVREKILIHVGPRATMPLYLLTPKQAERPLPVVIAFHGHGYGVKDVVGLWPDGAERDIPDGYQQDFAIALCRRGFAVAAPEIACFGERKTDFSYIRSDLGQFAPPKCNHSATLAAHLGGSVLGLRVAEGRRLVDFLQTRSDLDRQRLGAMGISGGGMHTFFSTILDPRIRACVVSGYFGTFRDSILAVDHCSCNYVPGLYQFGEMADLAGLIAPRPMLVEAGSYDISFPVAGVRRGVTAARRVYQTFGAAAQLETDLFDGSHRISGQRAYDFLWEKLGGDFKI